MATDNRLLYFNLSRIFEASDAEVSQATMAAVLARFNQSLVSGAKLVLICDETPFFIERCFEFFKFSMANVRKFGASVILIVQQSQHLERFRDTTLIDNAAHRFLFSIDGNASEFQARLKLSEIAMATLPNLKSSPQFGSEFLYQTDSAAKKMILRLTHEEYWRTTSSQADRLKIEKLRKAVPELSLEEALQCVRYI